MILSQESKSQSQLKSDLLKIKHDLSVGDSAAYAVMSMAGYHRGNRINFTIDGQI